MHNMHQIQYITLSTVSTVLLHMQRHSCTYKQHVMNKADCHSGMCVVNYTTRLLLLLINLIFSSSKTWPFVDITVSCCTLTCRTQGITTTLSTDDWRHQQCDNTGDIHAQITHTHKTYCAMLYMHILYKRQKYRHSGTCNETGNNYHLQPYSMITVYIMMIMTTITNMIITIIMQISHQ